MTTLKLKLNNNNLDQLVHYLIKDGKFDYENHGEDMSILISDNLLLLNLAVHLNIVILKKAASSIYIDVISGGGEDNLLHLAEKGYANSNALLMYDYAELYELQIEQIQES
ncbi:hypothetical protein [Adhaeribacter radiodurans]|uniref:Uncharacterized protein n=1 Tax=Adhaeribacter radiodurans TaxID=2745197 RepID=A0A7L7LC38_9BACT|nr:hypothetical protein [Adhaeribacter radiodurans]QMU30408.1 hypothetical protein HUW48_21335 [Adhaeribacter radiodurans]